MHKFVEPMTVGLIGVLLTFTACGVPNQPEVQSHSLCASRGRSSEPCNIIQGISANGIGEQVVGASIGGGGSSTFPNRVDDDYGVVAGGLNNNAGGQSVVSGGAFNVAGGFRTVIGGGNDNTTSAFDSVIGGGSQNSALGVHSTVSGGGGNLAANLDATIGGGSGNLAEGQAATIAGGTRNSAAYYATVGGGFGNLASGAFSTVSGGVRNQAEGPIATVGGGAGNQVFGNNAVISGGLNNSVLGDYAAVSGGRGNQANGDYSLAAGRSAFIPVGHDGVFLFADSNEAIFSSQTANEFAVRATGGVRFVSAVDDAGTPISGVMLPSGSGAWSILSSRSAKTELAPANDQDVLKRLAKLPIYTWSYAAQELSVMHIGPMAEDFYSTFGLGEDERYISTIDLQGVALAAIRAVNNSLAAEHARVERLEIENEELNVRLAALEQTVSGEPAGLSPELTVIFGSLLGLIAGFTISQRSLSRT